ncbi:hypothetical protein TWF730_010185 [Orbilia blumenaviensis]|uniref:Uncharacterized protein n=1 Tax=Orbilia blumenaviensis TaxID=1796055 RepID=A0AAV9URF1_9PEZI
MSNKYLQGGQVRSEDCTAFRAHLDTFSRPLVSIFGGSENINDKEKPGQVLPKFSVATLWVFLNIFPSVEQMSDGGELFTVCNKSGERLERKSDARSDEKTYTALDRLTNMLRDDIEKSPTKEKVKKGAAEIITVNLQKGEAFTLKIPSNMLAPKTTTKFIAMR